MGARTRFGFGQVNWANNSGEKTASAVISAEGCVLAGVVVATDGTNDVTVTLYDHATEASGTKLLPTFTVKGADGIGGCCPPFPIRAVNGVYLELSGDGAKANVYYLP